MKTTLVFLALIISQTASCQDTIRTIDKIFEVDSSRHAHVVDLRLASGIIDLGYNYLYKLYPRIEFGARAGFWYYHTRHNEIPENEQRVGFRYSVDLQGIFRLWKSVHFELDGGYFNIVSWPQAGNTTDKQGALFQGDFYRITPYIKAYLHENLMIKSGIDFIYYNRPNFWNYSYALSLGYKF